MADGATPQTNKGSASPRCPTCGSPARQRSEAEHAMLFAIIGQAWDQWPESHSFQPTSSEHLRGWLLVEVKHSISADIDGPKNITVNTVSVVRSLLKGLGSASETALVAMRIFETRTGIRVVVPKSIKHRVIDKKEFEAVAQRVYEIIESVLGVTVDDMKRMAKRGAP